jgi:hypothetical protein
MTDMVRLRAFALAGLVAFAGCSAARAQSTQSTIHLTGGTPAEIGAYAVRAMGCNDCHTPGWNPQGTLPQSAWMVGSSVGFRGPWGTVYPQNVRLLVAQTSLDNWLKLFHDTEPKDVMPFQDYNHGKVSDSDLTAIYTFVKSLGPAGRPAPSPLPPGVEPKTPYHTMAVPTP